MTVAKTTTNPSVKANVTDLNGNTQERTVRNPTKGKNGVWTGRVTMNRKTFEVTRSGKQKNWQVVQPDTPVYSAPSYYSDSDE